MIYDFGSGIFEFVSCIYDFGSGIFIFPRHETYLLTDVTNCSQPTRRVSMVYWVYLFSNTKLS